MKALICHTYIGTLIHACKAEGVDVIASQEEAGFGTDVQKHNWPDVECIARRADWVTKPRPKSDKQWFLIAHPPCSAGSDATPHHARGGLENPKSAFGCTADVMNYGYSVGAPIIAIESVPGTYRLKDSFETVRAAADANYSLTFWMDESGRYGCGSQRKRLWIIQARRDLFGDTFSMVQEPATRRTIHDCLDGCEGLTHHTPTRSHLKFYERFQKVLDQLPPGAGANKWMRDNDKFGECPRACHDVTSNGQTFKSVFYGSDDPRRLAWDLPHAPTITGGTKLLHPDLPRLLTTREYMRIQGMPDTFTFPESTRQSNYLPFIGKTVTPGIARWVVRQLKAALESPKRRHQAAGAITLSDGQMHDFAKGITKE